VSLDALVLDLSTFGDDVAKVALPRIGRACQERARAAARGPVMGARLDATMEIGAETLTVRPSPPGPWTLLELGSAKSHWRIPRRGSRRRIRINGNVRVYVIHGPIAAQQRWTKAKALMADDAEQIWRQVTADRWADVGD
jgi:hypothetical protein